MRARIGDGGNCGGGVGEGKEASDGRNWPTREGESLLLKTETRN